MGQGGGIFGSPLGKASEPEIKSSRYADKLAKMGEQYWNQTAPLRSQVVGRSTDFMRGNLDVTQSPVYTAGQTALEKQYGIAQNTLEDQYGVAQQQMLSSMPSGGGLQQGLSDLSSNRAGSLADLSSAKATSLSDLVSQLAQDEYSKAYGMAQLSPQSSMAGLTGAGGVMSPVLGSQANKQGAAMSAIGNICCFIFIAGHGYLHPIVRKYRDLKMNRQNRRGYYWLSDRLVPWMSNIKYIKTLVNLLMVKPMTSYGKYYFGINRIGVIFIPITAFWLLTYSMLGHRPPYRRKGTMEVV